MAQRSSRHDTDYESPIGAFFKGVSEGATIGNRLSRGRSILPSATPAPATATTPTQAASAITPSSVAPPTPTAPAGATTPRGAPRSSASPRGGEPTNLMERAVSNPVAAKEMYDYIRSKGVGHEHAIGMLSNIQGESRFNPSAYNPDDEGSPSGGLFQHHKDRLTKMNKAVPDWQTNWKGQVDFALSEPETQKYLGTKYKDGTEATGGFVSLFERPKDARGAAAMRSRYTPTLERLVSGQTHPTGMRSISPSTPVSRGSDVTSFMSRSFPTPRTINVGG